MVAGGAEALRILMTQRKLDANKSQILLLYEDKIHIFLLYETDKYRTSDWQVMGAKVR